MVLRAKSAVCSLVFLGVLFNNAVICWYYIISVLDEWMSIANWWNNDRGTWMYLEKNQSLATSPTTNPTSTGPEMNPGLRMKKAVTNHLRHGTSPTRKWNFSQLYTVCLPCPEIDKQVCNSRKPDVPQKLVSLQIQNFFFWHYSPWLTLASSKIVPQLPSVPQLTSPIPYAHVVETLFNWLKPPQLRLSYMWVPFGLKRVSFLQGFSSCILKEVSQPPQSSYFYHFTYI